MVKELTWSQDTGKDLHILQDIACSSVGKKFHVW